MTGFASLRCPIDYVTAEDSDHTIEGTEESVGLEAPIPATVR
jgi:hypothetical protein